VSKVKWYPYDGRDRAHATLAKFSVWLSIGQFSDGSKYVIANTTSHVYGSRKRACFATLPQAREWCETHRGSPGQPRGSYRA